MIISLFELIIGQSNKDVTRRSFTSCCKLFLEIVALIFSKRRCDSVETAELLGGQLKALASHTDNLARVNSLEGRARSNLGSDGRSTRESESSEGSGELRHDSVQTTTIYESLAAELRAKLGKYFFEKQLPPSSNYLNYLIKLQPYCIGNYTHVLENENFILRSCDCKSRNER